MEKKDEFNIDDIITVTDDNGNKTEAVILGILSYKKNNYIIYTDKNKEIKNNLMASRYEENEDELTLYPIETDEEWEYIEKEYLKICEKIEKDNQ